MYNEMMLGGGEDFRCDQSLEPQMEIRDSSYSSSISQQKQHQHRHYQQRD